MDLSFYSMLFMFKHPIEYYALIYKRFIKSNGHINYLIILNILLSSMILDIIILFNYSFHL